MILFLSDIAGSEIILILVFILIFFGSKSIPGIARTAGKTLRQIREASDGIQNEIRKTGMDIKKDLNLTQIIQQTSDDIQKPLHAYAQDLDQALRTDSPVKIQAPEKMTFTTEVAVEEVETNTALSIDSESEVRTEKPTRVSMPHPIEKPVVEKTVLKTKFPKL